MRCLVTGGVGFIGSNVVLALKEANHEVMTLDMRSEADLVMDISNTELLYDKFLSYRPDVVFHLAGISNARQMLNDPVSSMHINVAGTTSVFEAARRAEISRVILASTCWVAGALSPGVVDEEEPFSACGAGHLYTTSKIAAEIIAHDYQALYQQPFTILRYGIPYGPGMWQGLVLRSFLDRLAKSEPITIHGDGRATRRFLHVHDLGRAHVLSLDPIAANKVYHVDGAQAVSIVQMAETLLDVINVDSRIVYIDDVSRSGELKHDRNVLSTAKISAELGWKPVIGMREGLLATAAWYHDHIARIPGFISQKSR